MNKILLVSAGLAVVLLFQNCGSPNSGPRVSSSSYYGVYCDPQVSPDDPACNTPSPAPCDPAFDASCPGGPTPEFQ